MNLKMRFPELGFYSRPGAWLLGAGAAPLTRWLQALACGLSLSIAAGVGWQWLALARQLAQGQLQVPAQKAAAAGPSAAALAAAATAKPTLTSSSPSTAPALPPAERARINRVVRSLNTQWPALLGVLEQAASADVALLAIEPDAERGAIRVQAEGRTLDALLAHAERVQRSDAVAQLQLLRIDTEPEAADPRLSFDVVLRR